MTGAPYLSLAEPPALIIMNDRQAEILFELAAWTLFFAVVCWRAAAVLAAGVP